MNGRQKAIVIPSFIAVGIFTAVFGYGKLNQKVETNTEDIVEIKKDTKKIPVIENNVQHIMVEQRVIQTDIKEMLKLQKAAK